VFYKRIGIKKPQIVSLRFFLCKIEFELNFSFVKMIYAPYYLRINSNKEGSDFYISSKEISVKLSVDVVSSASILVSVL
jgi:hypothetical protein